MPFTVLAYSKPNYLPFVWAQRSSMNVFVSQFKFIQANWCGKGNKCAAYNTREMMRIHRWWRHDIGQPQLLIRQLSHFDKEDVAKSSLDKIIPTLIWLKEPCAAFFNWTMWIELKCHSLVLFLGSLLDKLMLLGDLHPHTQFLCTYVFLNNVNYITFLCVWKKNEWMNVFYQEILAMFLRVFFNFGSYP